MYLIVSNYRKRSGNISIVPTFKNTGCAWYDIVHGMVYGSGPQPVGRGPVPVRRPIGTGPRKKYSLEI